MPKNWANAGTLLRIWRMLLTLPGGRGLFSLIIRWAIPYSGSIRASIITLEPGYCQIQLKDRRAIRNHLNSIHAVALVNLGELASGLALNVGLPVGVRGIVTQISIEYFKKARGTLFAECRCQIPEVKEDMDFYVQTVIHDASKDRVASVSVKWRLGLVDSDSGS